MKIPLWNFEAISKMPDLLEMRNNTIKNFDKLIHSFEKQNLNYSEFKKYFKIDILATIL
jgi:hypothetical protein